VVRGLSGIPWGTVGRGRVSLVGLRVVKSFQVCFIFRGTSKGQASPRREACFICLGGTIDGMTRRNLRETEIPAALAEAERCLARLSGRASSPSLDESIKNLLEAARSARRHGEESAPPPHPLSGHLDQLQSGIASLRSLLGTAE